MKSQTDTIKPRTRSIEHFDVVVIGAGQAGVPLAYKLAGAGKTVALIERKQVGGSCVNFGCTPTKAAIASARLAYQIKHANDLGIHVPRFDVDFKAVMERARNIARTHRHQLEKSLKERDNPRLFNGHARIAGSHDEAFLITINANDELSLTAENVVLDTGTRSFVPSIEGLNDIAYLDSENWLNLQTLPTHLLMIGGGYVGVEMAQFFRRMGSRVTLIESGNQILSEEDTDVSEAIYDLLAAEDIELHISTELRAIEQTNNSLIAHLRSSLGDSEVAASHIFMAVGRKPNTDDLGLETIDLKVSDKGIIEADAHLSTSVKGVWVAGDIRGGPMFTHTSWDDYRTLLSQLDGDGSRVRSPVVPYAVFTDPELGRVGLTEQEARDKNVNFAIGKYLLESNSRAIETGETAGFIKVIVDRDTQRILGAAVVGSEAGELVHVYAALMSADAPYTVLTEGMIIHPTLCEAIQSSLSAVA